MTPAALAALAFAAGGVVFSGVALLGILRLPDCYSRAHATSKAETLGALLALAAACVAFDEAQATAKLGVLAVFLLITGPTAAHAVVRSAHQQGVPAAEGTRSVDATGDSDDGGEAS